MKFKRLVKKISGKFRRRLDGAGSAQTAYQTLQWGVQRYQEKQRLLNRRELNLIQACRNKLVLSAPERELIENSEAFLNQQTRSGRRIALIGFAVIILALSVLILWPLSKDKPDTLSTTLAVSNDAQDGAKAVPAEKLNRSPRMQTSNLPIKREQRHKLLWEGTEPDNSAAAPAATEAEKEENAFLDFSQTFPGLEKPIAGLPAPVTEPKPDPEPTTPEPAPKPETESHEEELQEKTVPSPVPAMPAESPKETGRQKEAKQVNRRFTSQETINTSYGKVMIVQEQGKWGLTDISGKYLLDPEYDLIKAFHTQRGLFLIERSGKRGIAQAKGNIILYPFFEHIKSYHLRESLLVVANNGKFGVYDEKEKEFAIGLEFKDICCLADGLFGVQMTDGKWGFIDRKGNMIIPPIYDALESPFEDGRALVQKGGRKYYIDKAGNVFPYKGDS